MTAAEFRESFEKCFACLFGEGGEFDEALRYAALVLVQFAVDYLGK